MTHRFGDLPQVELEKRKRTRHRNTTVIRQPKVPKRVSFISPVKPVLRFSDGDVIYRQDDVACSVFYIVNGRIKLTAVSGLGKEVVLGVLQDGHFFGEGCLIAKRSNRLATAASIGTSYIVSFTFDEIQYCMRDEEFVQALVADMAGAVGRLESALIDHIFNSTEKRLARILLLLANDGKDGNCKTPVMANISQETLAHMVGASRARVCSFMNKFRRQGFIEYRSRGILCVHEVLLNKVLDDQNA